MNPAAIVWQDKVGVWLETAGSRRPVAALWPALEQALAQAGSDSWAVGFAGYEWAATLDPLVAVREGRPTVPLAWWAVAGSAQAWRRPPDPCGHLRRLSLRGCSLSDEQYREGVARIREAIAAGDVYQVNLTRRWQATGVTDSAALFSDLVGRTSPRYGAYLADSRQGWAVMCLSPELFLARQGKELVTRPIKGTRRRELGRAGRAQARAALASSEKDAAELAMIVDLERNDLHRVCRPGSVRVQRAAAALSAGDVIHHEAVVAGELDEGVGWREILTSTFPGGSVTGAPKLAACRMIAALEPVARGVYCGMLGVLRACGDAVFALPIRTGVAHGDILEFHAGGGVVWDSDPAAEERESRDKVAGWLRLAGGDG